MLTDLARPVGIADCVSAIDSSGQRIWIADAHRGDGKRFVVRADEKLTAFTELESEINYTSVSVTTLPFQRSLQ